ncbi:hypothetical protein ULMA_18310 [Patiriisocius marinus]|uniref:Uncharacterized protein n=2 Tax=Patiriisocius marinus TaxID=1397112 RepID=A0A5J4J1K9_9FLAO|nr:hypothetical protein ULMA_18310 [Patiriisocius marinus]
MEAQNFELYSSPNINKIHQSYVANEKHTDGNEIGFIKIPRTDKKFTQAELLKYEQVFLKMKQYQDHLIALGFDLKIAGTAKHKTIKAFHNYLKKRPIASIS